jgi:glycosyltransferase involved in cell wall biosynthesis
MVIERYALGMGDTPKAPGPLGTAARAATSLGAAVPRRKVRVLFLNDTSRNGGPGRSLFHVLKFLDPSVVHRAVLLPRPGVIGDMLSDGRVTDELVYEPSIVENPIEPWSRAIRRADFDAPVALRSLRFAGNVARGGWGFVRLASLVQTGRFDLVYCNGTTADFFGGAVASVVRVPALWHVRYTSVPRAVASVHDRLASSRGVRRILCVSRASAALFPQCPEKVRVLHNALDLEAFAPHAETPTLRTELGLSRDTVIFGSHGRIVRRKGYVEMLHAAKLARTMMTPEERAKSCFVVVGDTPEDMRPDHLGECRALARELELGDWFRFVGFRPDVRPLVADFDVAIIPSVYPDPLPRAVLESMALGKPVLAFDVGGVAEMLEDGVTGVLLRGPPRGAVDHGGADVEGLARAIVAYLRDPALRARHGSAARARVVRDFDGATRAREIEGEIVRASGLAA